MSAEILRLLRKAAEQWDDSSDAFGKLTADGTTNLLGLPSFNPFSEERYRYIENGTRLKTPDADSTRFTDQDKNFRIEPQAGDTIELKSAEAPRYIPSYDVDVSWAYKFDTFLQDADDKFTMFVEGCYELRLFGDGTAEVVAIEGGSDNVVETVNYKDNGTAPYRPVLTFNWYDVGRADWNLTFTDDDPDEDSGQLTINLAELTDDEDWLSDSPVGRVGFELDVASSGIQLEAGSMAYIPQGEISPTARPKPFALHNSELGEIPQTGYGVIGALRIDPERDEIFTTITELAVEGATSVDTEIYLKAVPPADTDADFIDVRDDGSNAGPAYPRQNSPQNSVLQFTPNVSTFPTRTDPLTGDTIPNGRLVGLATEYSSGTGQGTKRGGASFQRPRPIYFDDVVLIIGVTPDASTSQQPNLFGASLQDW